MPTVVRASMSASLPGRHHGLIVVPHLRNEVTRDLLGNGGGHKKSGPDRGWIR